MELYAELPNNLLGLPLTLPLIFAFKTEIPFVCIPLSGGAASEVFWMKDIPIILSDLRLAHGR